MARYTLHLLDHNDATIGVFECAGDDLDALDAARDLAKDNVVEVWSNRGRIARVKKGDAPSGPEDSVSG